MTRQKILTEILETEQRYLDRMKPPPNGNCTLDEMDKQWIVVLRAKLALLEEMEKKNA